MSTDEFGTRYWPVEVRVKTADKALEIEFDDGQNFRYPAEYLRIESPSAEVKGHTPADRKLVAGRRHVGIMAVEPVGNYAIRIKFDDMHDTGIYTWNYLYELGRDFEPRWHAYLGDLAAHGLSRDP